MNCGLFNMNYSKNSHNIDLKFPCAPGHMIELLVLERDFCGDEWKKTII